MTRCGIVSPRSWTLRLPLERLLRVLGGLLDGGRHFVGLAVAPGDPAIAVADDDQGIEAEAPAALDDGGAAADLHHALFQAVLPAFPRSFAMNRLLDHVLATCTLGLRGSNSCQRPSSAILKLQAAFAGGVGQRLDAAMITIMAAIERRLGDALFLGASAIFLPTALAALMLPP